MTARRKDAAQIIWLTDLHYDNAPVLGHDASARIDAAVRWINAHYRDAEFCVISGDVVEHASEQSYADVKALLDQLTMPWWPMVGNHDRRSVMRRLLSAPNTAMDGYQQYVLDAGPARLICLDSLVEGADHGHLCAERLAWVEQVLSAEPERPSIVMLHHPPMDLGLPMLDPDKLENGDELLALLARFPSVKQLCFGHVHRPVMGQIGGLAYAGLRAVLYQAPPPVPDWDWSRFAPVLEAPQLGVITCTADHIGIQAVEFCPATLGLTERTVG